MSTTTPYVPELIDLERRFAGVRRLYGAKAFARIAAARVCIVGVGGVGSWCAEALARSGVGALVLVDLDIVVESNVNRQLQALSAEIGRPKVEVLAERIAGINPHCAVRALEDRIDSRNVQALLTPDLDFVVDCADNFHAKAAIIAHCKRSRIRIVTIGGAGGVSDPLLIRAADLTRTVQDPLLAKTRKHLRGHYGYTRNPQRRFEVPAVFSAEQPRYPTADGGLSLAPPPDAALRGLGCATGVGSAMPVTATFAMVAAAHVLRKLATPAAD
ncbi:MAG: ThiF family adenylyltransferase [Gammaproteobacteria bacterium]